MECAKCVRELGEWNTRGVRVRGEGTCEVCRLGAVSGMREVCVCVVWGMRELRVGRDAVSGMREVCVGEGRYIMKG